MRTAKEMLNRGNNLFVCGFLAVLGAGAIPEIPTEGAVKGGIDETLMAVVGVVAVAWYLRNRYQRSLVPLGLTGAMVVVKILPLLYEDIDDRGDDIGILITVLIFAVIWSVVYFRSKNAVESGVAVAS